MISTAPTPAANKSRKIFIAGCARSGTDLSRDLMACFRDTYALPHEARVSTFADLDRSERYLVVKRTAGSYRSLHALPPDVGLIYCVRHPFDVLTSSHPQTVHLRRFHVTPERWINEYDGLIALHSAQPQRQIFYLRYEDLVSQPDAEQARMVDFFGLEPRIRFSEDPDHQIFASSIRKWETRPEFRDYVLALPIPFLKRVAEFCDEFGYEFPET